MTVNPAALKLPGVEKHPTKIVPRRMTIAERMYLPLLGGLMVTIRHMVLNLLRIRKRVTIEYPEERREYSPRYRGHHILTTRPDGSVRCVACYLCATACPAECIHIEAAEHPDVNIEKYPVVYEIDMLRCVFCGYCVDACPKEAIIMSREHEMAFTSREEAIVGIEELRQKGPIENEDIGYRPYY
jgi:NADH-quinone oxidoreductase subunit I